jgi:serine/threonine-protein kinase
VTTGSGTVGKYSLVELLGDDGRCTRWRASQGDPDSEVLLTLMQPAVLGGADGVARFRNEIRRAVELNSPFVALVLDDGVAEENGAPYVVTELLRGQSLAERLSHARLRARDVARYALQVGEALSEALEKGILHRDLRPENITLVGDADEEMVKIQDFGVAGGFWAASLKAGQAFAESSPRAASYMSPEQLRAPKSVDHRTDLWSLAVIVFECLTGRHPFDASASAQQTKFQVKRGPRPVPSSVSVVPKGFDEWFARATARDIRERFQSAAEMTSTLQTICCKPEMNDASRSLPRTLAPALDVSWGVAVPAAPPSVAAPISSTGAALAAPTSGATGSTGSTGVRSGAPAASSSPAPSTSTTGSGSFVSGLPATTDGDLEEPVGAGPSAFPAGFDAGLAGAAVALPPGPSFTTIRRDELRFLMGAGVLLGIAMVGLTALWFRFRGPLPEPRATPADLQGSESRGAEAHGTGIRGSGIQSSGIQ